MDSDRRSEERIQVWFEVSRAHPPLEGVATISNLSPQGARLNCSGPQPSPGQSIRVSIRMTGGSPVVIHGAVVRAEADGFAVSFDKPNPEIAALLAPERAVETTAATPGPVVGLHPFRQIAATCHGEGHWLSGRICTPPKRNLLDHLNADESFLRIRDAASPGQSGTLPFLALRSDALDVVVPGADQTDLEPDRIGNFVGRPLRCLLSIGLLEGQLSVLEKIRVSDFLMRCAPFIVLRDCTLRLKNAETGPLPDTVQPFVIVNTRRVIGISDMAPSPPPDPEASS